MRDAFKTIVGGRSADSKPAGNSPRGIEILLKKASVDEDFAKVLLDSPEEAARLISLDLQTSEKTILTNTPRSTLQTMIRNTTVKPRQLSAFKTMSASLMLAAIVLASSLASACDCGTTYMSRGISPDNDQERCELDFRCLHTLLDSYAAEHDWCYPTTSDWYGQNNPLVEAGLVHDSEYLYDPWHNLYHYEGIEQDGKVINYRLESYGPDGVDSEDDIQDSDHSW